MSGFCSDQDAARLLNAAWFASVAPLSSAHTFVCFRHAYAIVGGFRSRARPYCGWLLQPVASQLRPFWFRCCASAPDSCQMIPSVYKDPPFWQGPPSGPASRQSEGSDLAQRVVLNEGCHSASTGPRAKPLILGMIHSVECGIFYRRSEEITFRTRDSYHASQLRPDGSYPVTARCL